MTFVVCIDNDGYEASLEPGKTYQMVPPEANDPKDYLRIIYESVEGYLYLKKVLSQLNCLNEPSENCWLL